MQMLKTERSYGLAEYDELNTKLKAYMGVQNNTDFTGDLFDLVSQPQVIHRQSAKFFAKYPKHNRMPLAKELIDYLKGKINKPPERIQRPKSALQFRPRYRVRRLPEATALRV